MQISDEHIKNDDIEKANKQSNYRIEKSKK